MDNNSIEVKIRASKIMDGELKQIIQTKLSKRQKKYEVIYIDFYYDKYDIQRQIELLIEDELIDINDYADTLLLERERSINKILQSQNMHYIPGTHFQAKERAAASIKLCDNECWIVNYCGIDDQLEKLYSYYMVEKVLQAIKSVT